MPSEEELELRAKEKAHDDGLPWGFIDEAGYWHELPKKPMLLADLGPPPFSTTLPTGQVRLVVHRPEYK